MNSPSLSLTLTPRLWSGHHPSPSPHSDLLFKEQRLPGGKTRRLRVTGRESGGATVFCQMASSAFPTSMISLFHLFCSLHIKDFPAFTNILSPFLSFLSSLFTPISPMPVVEEGVVIITLVIPDSSIAREYTSETLRTVPGAVKHTHNELYCLCIFQYLVFFFRRVKG